MAMLISVGIASAQGKTTKTVSQPEIVYVVDGKVMSSDDFLSIFPSTIESMKVIKSKDDPDFKKYSKENTEMVMLITTKTISQPEVVYVVDGKVMSSDDFLSISPSTIESMKVIKLKDDPDFKKYSKEKTEMVMMITTKK